MTPLIFQKEECTLTNSCMGDSDKPVRHSAVQKSHFLETVQKQSVDGLRSSPPGDGGSGTCKSPDKQGCHQSPARAQPEASGRPVTGGSRTHH